MKSGYVRKLGREAYHTFYNVNMYQTKASAIKAMKEDYDRMNWKFLNPDPEEIEEFEKYAHIDRIHFGKQTIETVWTFKDDGFPTRKKTN